MAATYTQDTEAPEVAEALSDEEREARQAEEDADIVQRAKDCYRLGMDATADWRQEAIEDFEFLAGEQWDGNVKGERDAQGRPALTINRLPLLVRSVTNEQRQSKPAVTITPIDDQSDSRTAEVLQGTIRNIERTSNADSAYSTGGQNAAIGGLGFWDVRADYETERSFDQTLGIVRIPNPFSCLMDPAAKEVAGDDARWVLLTTDISRDEFKSMYPGRDVPSAGGMGGGQGDTAADWVSKDGVRIHEYRWVEEVPDTLFDISQVAQQLPELEEALKSHGVDLTHGTVLASEVGEEFAKKLDGLPSRETTRRRARFVKIAGGEVLERGNLAGKYLQLVRVVGGEIEVNGKKVYEGVIRHTKDPQKALNFYVSAQTEAIALTPKSPFIAAEGQLEGYEEMWEEANNRARSVLIYKPTSISGELLPRPERVNAEANIQAISQAIITTNQQFSETSGIYPTQYGAPSPEQSGRAILARQNQGQTGNFHFTDNFAMAIRYTGRILVDLIPKIYAGPRLLRILGEDDKHEMVPVNGHPGEFRGETTSIPLDAGRYDVAVTMGPSYLSKRQESAAQMLELMRSVPQVGPLIMDLVVRSLDMPDAKEIAKRIEKTLPPAIRPQDNENAPPQQVLMQQVQQLSAQNQEMTQHLHQLSQIIETKAQELAAKKEIALIEANTQLLVAKAKLNSADANAALDRDHEFNQAQYAHAQAREEAALETQTPSPAAPQQGAPNGGPQLAQPGSGSAAGPGGNPGVLLPGAGPIRGLIPGRG